MVKAGSGIRDPGELELGLQDHEPCRRIGRHEWRRLDCDSRRGLFILLHWNRQARKELSGLGLVRLGTCQG